jgi:hypothetical protein
MTLREGGAQTYQGKESVRSLWNTVTSSHHWSDNLTFTSAETLDESNQAQYPPRDESLEGDGVILVDDTADPSRHLHSATEVEIEPAPLCVFVRHRAKTW